MAELIDIKEGFKNTKIGIVPIDWEVKVLGEVSNIFRGGSPRPIEAFITQDVDGVNWIKIGDVDKAAKYIYSTKERISNRGVSFSRKVNDGDFLLSNSMSFGRPYILRTSGCIHDGWLVIQDYQSTFNSDFLYYLLSFETTLNQYRTLAAGSTVLNLNKEIVNKVYVQFPKIDEQNSVAQALSDIDWLIVEQEKLIEKKRNIKQGAMQELLKPKQGWQEKFLGETATLKARIGWQGLTTSEYRKTGEYYLITGTEFKNGFIDWSSCYYVDEERYKQDRNIQVKAHDILVTKDGTIGKVALIKTVSKPATLNSGVFVIRPIANSFHPEFFYYLLLSEIFLTFLSQLSAGSTINHLYQKDFVTFKYFTPKSIDEQKQVANVLWDMDSEIEELEAKLHKFKMVKQGMMQSLLTGKIRLV
jgi:type I restriction enzyme S subunit